jgi:N-acyl homoserine lactone hydrolase
MKAIKEAVKIATAAACVTFAFAPAALAQVERLYILECGQGHTGDMSRWTPGQNANVPKDIVDNCYLIKHTQGYFMWDTGVADSTPTDTPNSADPKALTWRRPKTLAAQLAELGVKPDDVKYVAISHTHPDHIGNVELFPKAMLLVQKAEYEWPDASGKLEGDRDVFGDGSVTILSTPGHTPGHQSLLVKLPKTGARLLTGDAVHFQSNWDGRIVPGFNFDQAKTATSMARMADVLAKEHGQIWINHDKPQRESLKLAPAFYE